MQVTLISASDFIFTIITHVMPTAVQLSAKKVVRNNKVRPNSVVKPILGLIVLSDKPG